MDLTIQEIIRVLVVIIELTKVISELKQVLVGAGERGYKIFDEAICIVDRKLSTCLLLDIVKLLVVLQLVTVVDELEHVMYEFLKVATTFEQGNLLGQETDLFFLIAKFGEFLDGLHRVHTDLDEVLEVYHFSFHANQELVILEVL